MKIIKWFWDLLSGIVQYLVSSLVMAICSILIAVTLFLFSFLGIKNWLRLLEKLYLSSSFTSMKIRDKKPKNN